MVEIKILHNIKVSLLMKKVVNVEGYVVDNRVIVKLIRLLYPRLLNLKNLRVLLTDIVVAICLIFKKVTIVVVVD